MNPKLHYSLLLLGLFLFNIGIFPAWAQDFDKIQLTTANSVGNGYSISLEPIVIGGFAGLQSFAAAQLEGKWVLIGGRTDGLHRMQPFASFSESGNNTNIVVIDPEAKQTWNSKFSDLPPALNEQLQSTNMQFIQRGKTLYLIGGYGYSKSAGNHVTHDKLTAVKVDCLILAVQKGSPIAPCFRQIADPAFAITGGQIGRIGETYYLVGGQKFEGRYNPMGPDHGPGFSQQYSNQIRKFRIRDNGVSLAAEIITTVTDGVNLHRRDFNMLPQVFPHNLPGFTVFSGVFQVGANLPYTNTVDVFADKHTVNGSFTQYLNHYHCAKVALYDAEKQKMENIFFGGISQYEESEGVFTSNKDVPFTKTIAKISREKDGKMIETKIADLPEYFGAGAEFLINPNLPADENEIVKISEIKGVRILLGHIVGGIQTTRKTVFFGNSGAESKASTAIYKVWLTRSPK